MAPADATIFRQGAPLSARPLPRIRSEIKRGTKCRRLCGGCKLVLFSELMLITRDAISAWDNEDQVIVD